MARRGKVNELKVDLTNYSYILNGVGGIGKTTLAYELGKKITGSNEGTFIISIGEEPTPDHIDGALYDKAPDWSELMEITEDLIENKSEYPYTKFVAPDSMDELFRIAEAEVVRMYNKDNPEKKVKLVSQAYGGFQKGENKALDLVINWFGSLRNAGYSLFFIGHTKQKNKKDLIQDIEFTQYTNKLDSKYYEAIKDKVTFACMAYNEMEIADVTEVKDAFTKGKKKVGNLIGSKRVLVFRDDDYGIDTKSHFKHIVSKVDFSTDNFIAAITNAIKAELEEVKGKEVSIEELEDLVKQQQAEKQEMIESKREMLNLDKEAPSNQSLVAQIQKAVNDKAIDMVELKRIMSAYKIKNFANADSLPTEGLIEIVSLIK